jgi:hypothetical protein
MIQAFTYYCGFPPATSQRLMVWSTDLCDCGGMFSSRPLGRTPDTRLYRIKLYHVVRSEASRLPSCFLDLRFYIEDGGSTETSVTCYYTTRRHNPEDTSLQSHRCENYKPQNKRFIDLCQVPGFEGEAERRGRRSFGNLGACLPNYTTSHPTRQNSSPL